MDNSKSLADILSGLIFIGIGLAFGIAAAGYDIGSAFRMGPGYFPIVLAGMLCLLGAIIVAKGILPGATHHDIGSIPWRGMILLLGAIAFFGFTIRGLGLVPSLFITLMLASMASRRNTLVSATLLSAGLTAFCVIIFIYALGVPLALFGPWVRF